MGGQICTSRLTHWVTAVLAVAILVPSMVGFANKFLEFAVLVQQDNAGAFAIAPVLNYLLASAGFLLLLGWATRNGMFRDVEQPKWKMLEQERLLDSQQSAAGWSVDAKQTSRTERVE
ncbi:MAG: hypothetical protein KatS3mg110_0566 [Pirellulaceae bacterium]|nr:MAG: hypothetical protein KatS3mg110_0566 [Pirellulaceae bacterium]